eukprot:7330120-Lingulodinium_polyedra.AAC.1
MKEQSVAQRLIRGGPILGQERDFGLEEILRPLIPGLHGIQELSRGREGRFREKCQLGRFPAIKAPV